MTKRIRLGVLTPSSNTALEPLTSAMVAELPGVSAHFARFGVTEISLSDAALGQFDDSRILAAAELLADARVDVIGWSGTAAGWLGFDSDRRLCERITERTGIAATTSVLALNELFERMGVRRFGLVTPYQADVQQRIVDNYAAAGFECVAERHLDICVNYEFAEVEPAHIEQMFREVCAAGPQAITTFCTNLRAAQLAAALERDTGVVLLDTVSTVLWKMLRMTGVETGPLAAWGRLFELR